MTGGWLAQSVEHQNGNRRVLGSSTGKAVHFSHPVTQSVELRNGNPRVLGCTFFSPCDIWWPILLQDHICLCIKEYENKLLSRPGEDLEIWGESQLSKEM